MSLLEILQVIGFATMFLYFALKIVMAITMGRLLDKLHNSMLDGIDGKLDDNR